MLPSSPAPELSFAYGVDAPPDVHTTCFAGCVYEDVSAFQGVKPSAPALSETASAPAPATAEPALLRRGLPKVDVRAVLARVRYISAADVRVAPVQWPFSAETGTTPVRCLPPLPADWLPLSEENAGRSSPPLPGPLRKFTWHRNCTWPPPPLPN
jgi:hypothetical protein